MFQYAQHIAYYLFLKSLLAFSKTHTSFWKNLTLSLHHSKTFIKKFDYFLIPMNMVCMYTSMFIGSLICILISLGYSMASEGVIFFFPISISIST